MRTVAYSDAMAFRLHFIGAEIGGHMAQRIRTESRRAVRLAVNGEITGRLVASGQSLEIRDIGGGGFLAETSAAIDVDSVHHVRLATLAGTGYVIAARCAHCRQRSDVREPRFVVGFAFTTPNQVVDRLLDQVMMGAISFD